MTEYVFSCRIDGRAGYVRLWSDALELIRSGRRGAGEPEFVWLGAVTRVATGKPGRLFTTVQIVADGVTRELTFPAADAPRVAELIEALVVAQAEQPEQARQPEPAYSAEPVLTMFSMPSEPPARDVPAPDVPTVVEAAVEVSGVEVSSVEVPEFELPDLTVPDFSVVAPEMPEWTPLPDVEGTAGALAQNAVLAIAEEPVAASAEAERPTDLPEETEERLSRLEVLRSCGIVTEADFAETEAEILESAWTEARSA